MGNDVLLAHYREKTNEALAQRMEGGEGEVCAAMRYSLLGGGKRVRASLALAVCELLSGGFAAAMPAACAVEMLHCYSLIHDDLPCMDDDDYRRGRPSCHIRFGEATALLAGDALLTKAFGTLCGIGDQKAALRCVSLLASAAGCEGMILGQELDLAGIAGAADKAAALDRINAEKTGKLIGAAVLMGAACAGGASDENLAALREYAACIGTVFQLVDDVLDETSSLEALGKSTGNDARNEKLTYAALFGAEGAMARAASLTEQACVSLRPFGAGGEYLAWFAKQLLARTN